jgi:hypothetical protein
MMQCAFLKHVSSLWNWSAHGVRNMSGKRPRGSLHQQIACLAVTSLAAASNNTSHLECLLVELVTWGTISVPLSQKIGAAVKKDCQAAGIAVFHGVAEFASLGASGQYPNNMHRDLFEFKLAPPVMRPALFSINLWIKSRALTVELATLKVLWPHAFFGTMFDTNKPAFVDKVLGGDSRNVDSFWGQMAGTRKYLAHPVKDRPDHHHYAVPILLHGDDVTVTGVVPVKH